MVAAAGIAVAAMHFQPTDASRLSAFYCRNTAHPQSLRIMAGGRVTLRGRVGIGRSPLAVEVFLPQHG